MRVSAHSVEPHTELLMLDQSIVRLSAPHPVAADGVMLIQPARIWTRKVITTEALELIHSPSCQEFKSQGCAE